MKDDLAERLLASIMEWSPEDVAHERPILQAMASYKYDEYGQFSPGMRFVESLAVWLKQFDKEHRQIAYDFVKNRLIFCSISEVEHLVSMTYPDIVKPILFDYVAQALSIPNRYVCKIAASQEFRILRRKCLFFGLSDGSRTDIFRRSNPELSHEQIWQAYEVSTEKKRDMLKDLSKDLDEIGNSTSLESEPSFQVVFLLDDFSGSGKSYIRKDPDSGEFKGKIAKFYKQVCEESNNEEIELRKLISRNNLQIYIVLYIATMQARQYLEQALEDFFKDKPVKWGLRIVHQFTDQVPLSVVRDREFLALVEQNKYYDPSVEDKHTKVGGGNVKKGFASCQLPLVLSHNTPNNSVFLLWADPQLFKVRGLFPRISRHRS